MRQRVTGRVWVVVSLLMVLMSCALSASAQPDPQEPSLADKETARALFAEGDEKYRAGDFEGALKAFVAADEVMRVPTTGLERGRTLAQLGRLLEAHEVLLRVVRTPPIEDESQAFIQARADAKALSTELKRRIPTLLVNVSGLAPGESYELKVDGEDVPETLHGIARKVDPGDHEVIVRSNGYVTVTKTASLKEGDNAELSLSMRQEGSTAAPEEVDEGGLDIRFGMLSAIGVGLAGAGVVVGAVAGGITMSRVSDLDEACPAGRASCPPEAQEDIDAANLSSHVSTAGFVIAGVGVAVAIVGLFVHFDGGAEAEDSEVALRPWSGGDVAGVELSF